MQKLILSFCILLLANFNLHANEDATQLYDSLSTVLSISTDKKDFAYVDSLIGELEGEFNYLPLRKLIYIGASRSRELKYEYYLARFVFRESIINTIRGDIGNGMKLATEALEIFKKQNVLDAAGCYNTMGNMVAGEGDIEKGLEYLEKAFEITARFKDDPKYEYLMCNHYVVTGYIHILNEDYEAAKPYLQSGLELATKVNHYSTQVYIYLNMAKISKFEKNFEKTFETLEKAMEIAKAHEQVQLVCLVYIHYADTYFAMEDRQVALNYYLFAEEIALEQSLKRRSLGIYEKMIAIYTDLNNYQAALTYQDKYIKLLKELEERERDNLQLMHEIKFEVNEKNAQIKALDLKRKEQASEKTLLQTGIILTVVFSLLIILIILLIFNRNRLSRRIESERLEKGISLHQMTALKSQMNPHFTFNALTSIQDLILKEKTEESYGYITKFANLVRQTLNHSSEEFIAIEDEFSSLKLYLELEKLRFKDDLIINFETSEIIGVNIPPLIIQPFIENALKHGLLHKEGTKNLTIKFQLTDVLICTVIDNGVGRESSKKIQERRRDGHTSFAISSIANRLEIFKKLYDFNLGIEYTDLHEGDKPTGTSVKLTLPIQRSY